MARTSGNQAGKALQAAGRDVLVQIKVVPGASRTRVSGLLGDRVKIAVAAAAEKGRANAALLSFLADTCGRPRNQIEITAGHGSPQKTVRIRGITVTEVGRCLGLSPAPGR